MAAQEHMGADAVARKAFATTFRGFDQHEVRAFLGQVATELAAVQERERSLRERLASAEARALPPELSEAELDAVIGQEAAKVLRAAHEAAAEIRSRAEEQAARLIREANAEGNRVRGEAEGVLSLRTGEAEAAAAAIRSDAEAQAEAAVEAARSRGREMVAEAQVVRERVLRDLARRRRLAHLQLEQMRVGRERLLEAYRVVRATTEEATRELTVAEAEARAAAETAAHRADAEPEPTVEELEAEVAAARDAGLARATAELMARTSHAGEDHDEPDQPAAASAEVSHGDVPGPHLVERAHQPSEAPASAAQEHPGAGEAEERRTSALRILRRRADPDAAAAKSPATEPGEAVRLIRPEQPSPPAPGSTDQPAAAGSDDVDEGVRLIRPEQPSPPAAEPPAASGDEPAEGVRLLPAEPPPAAAPERGPEPPLPDDAVEGVRVLPPEPPHPVEPAAADAGDLEPPASAESPAASVEAGAGEGGDDQSSEPRPAPEQRDVDELFARLRAGRAAAVAHAETVLSEHNGNGHGAAAEPTEQASPPAAEPAESTSTPAPAASEEVTSDADEAVLQARDAETEPLERALLKACKRALADEQNEVLDTLRRLRGAPTLEALLPPADEHLERWAAVARRHLAAAASAGSGGAAAPDVDDLATDLAREVTDDLRTRVGRAVEEVGGDEAALTDSLSATYREWKTGRAEPLARHQVTAAHARGRFAAVPPGPQRWVVDAEEGGCPDCDDNALAGPVDKGEAFPTGQLHPPAHAGCRCLVVPATH